MNLMTVAISNLRFAWRTFRKSPTFFVTAVLCLGLGIGACTTVFSAVRGVLLRPLPYRNAGGLLRIYSQFPSFGNGSTDASFSRFWLSPPEYLDLKRDMRTVTSVEGWTTLGSNISSTGREPVRTTTTVVTGGLLPMLGVKPALGRAVSPEDDRFGVPRVVVISYGLWQSVFASDPKVIHRDVYADGEKLTATPVVFALAQQKLRIAVPSN